MTTREFHGNVCLFDSCGQHLQKPRKYQLYTYVGAMMCAQERRIDTHAELGPTQRHATGCGGSSCENVSSFCCYNLIVMATKKTRVEESGRAVKRGVRKQDAHHTAALRECAFKQMLIMLLVAPLKLRVSLRSADIVEAQRRVHTRYVPRQDLESDQPQRSHKGDTITSLSQWI